MKIKNHLNTDQLRHLAKTGKRKEKVNWKDVMGMNNRGMRRSKGGAMRNA